MHDLGCCFACWFIPNPIPGEPLDPAGLARLGQTETRGPRVVSAMALSGPKLFFFSYAPIHICLGCNN